jgi:hypothetical protein
VTEKVRQGVAGTDDGSNGHNSGDKGYEIVLATQMIQVQDDAVVSEGTHRVWIPGYLTM